MTKSSSKMDNPKLGQSVTNRNWEFKQVDDKKIKYIINEFADKYKLNYDSAVLLAMKNFDDQENQRFLEPKLLSEMPRMPESVAGVIEAAKVLLKAVEEKKKSLYIAIMMSMESVLAHLFIDIFNQWEQKIYKHISRIEQSRDMDLTKMLSMLLKNKIYS